jgi:thymidylate kinase
MIISFSGIDSCGKSTQIRLIENYFNKKNIRYKNIWSRGGYTNWFEFIKQVARKLSFNKLPPSGVNEKRTKMFENSKFQKVWLCIALLDLIRLYAVTFRFNCLLGYNIICDRYLWDTYIDFKFAFPDIDLEKQILWKILCKLAVKPDVSIIITISPEESWERSVLKEEPFSETLERRREREALYKRLIKGNKWMWVINGQDSIDSIWQKIKGIIDNDNK